MPSANNNMIQLRRALGRFAAGVTVVTTCVRTGGAIGLTVKSFSSVSLDPPLVLWSINHMSRSLEEFRKAGRFAVNVLSTHRRDLATCFCAKISDRFAGIDYELGELKVPLLPETIASFQCKTVSEHIAGGYLIVIGAITKFNHTDDPLFLLYCQGGFGTLDIGNNNELQQI